MKTELRENYDWRMNDLNMENSAKSRNCITSYSPLISMQTVAGRKLTVDFN